jgi:hypothetical protein
VGDSDGVFLGGRWDWGGRDKDEDQKERPRLFGPVDTAFDRTALHVSLKLYRTTVKIGRTVDVQI